MGPQTIEGGNQLIVLAHPTRFERVTFAFGGQRWKISLAYPKLLGNTKRKY
jgi:hypothetical protein